MACVKSSMLTVWAVVVVTLCVALWSGAGPDVGRSSGVYDEYAVSGTGAAYIA